MKTASNFYTLAIYKIKEYLNNLKSIKIERDIHEKEIQEFETCMKNCGKITLTFDGSAKDYELRGKIFWICKVNKYNIKQVSELKYKIWR